MVHKGIEYEITMIEPGLWKYHFRIGDMIKSGKTVSSLKLRADRRVRTVIDRELKAIHTFAQRSNRPRAKTAR